MSLLSLLLRCWFGHDLSIYVRREGVLQFQCSRCDYAQPILQSQTIKGPQYHASAVPGTPRTKTIRLATKPTAVAATFRGRR
jgi:hypothetical protein